MKKLIKDYPELIAARAASYKAQKAYAVACEVYRTAQKTDRAAYEVYIAARTAVDTTAQKLIQLRSVVPEHRKMIRIAVTVTANPS
jgi:hypothetical protein